MKRSICLLAIVVSVMFVACARKTTVDEVINKAVQSSGGAERLAALHDQISTWDSKTMMPMGDSLMTMTGEMVITYKRPDKLKFEGKAPDGLPVWATVFDGTNGWQYMMGQGVRDMTAAEIQETTAMAETWIDGWLNYAEKGIELTMLADTTLEGKAYHVIRATDRFGNVSTNHCDPQTGLMARMESEMTDPMTLAKKPGAMTFADYALHDGCMMATKVSGYDDKGAMTFDATLKQVSFNTGVADDAFAKPTPAAPPGAAPSTQP